MVVVKGSGNHTPGRKEDLVKYEYAKAFLIFQVTIIFSPKEPVPGT